MKAKGRERFGWAVDREAAHVVSAHAEQGRSLLWNGVVLFDDFGEILPNGRSISAPRPRIPWPRCDGQPERP
jgi:Family of unknown function (DUF5999)